MNEILLSGGVGIVSSLVTWILTKRKQDRETDSISIKNMNDSLEFYKSLADDNKKRLEQLAKDNKELLKDNKQITEDNSALREEIRDLKDQVFKIMAYICTDMTCQIRAKNMDLFPSKQTK